MSSQPSILGHYKVERTLGTGAMGVVYEGTDLKLHRKVAIKTFRKDEHGELAHDYSNRFLREAQAVARLNHPHIVQVYDFGEEDDMSFIVMELIQGTNLKAALEEARLPLAETVRIMGELLDALDFAHRAGIIHRDIKPANIMLDRQRRTKLTDFGVARLVDLERTSGERTQAGTIVGTPAYMSPEQVQGQAIDHRSDIFSAGVVLYQLLTGRKPFDGGAYTVSKRIVEAEPPRPSSIVQSISPAWDSVVSRAMGKIPERRFSRAKEFAEALRRALESAPPEVDHSAETVIRPDPAAEARKATSTQASADKPEKSPSPTASGTNAAQHSEAELEFWRSVRESDDPDDLDLYVEKFPAGLYVDLARRKAAKLRRPPGANEEDSDIRTRETEDEVWRSVKDSVDADDIEFYVEKFPNGRYVELARRKIAKLRRGGAVGEDTSGSGGLNAELAQRDTAEARERAEKERAEREAAERAEKERAEKEAAERAEREAAERARREGQERAEHEARERAAREAEEGAKREAQAAEARRQAEARARREAEEKAKREAEERAKREAEEKAKREADEKSRREAEERSRREAQARREAEERARSDAEERARRDAEDKSRRDAEERKRREAEAVAAAAAAAAQAKREGEERERREADEAQRREALESRRRETDEGRRRELQEKQRQADSDLSRRAAAERAREAAEVAARPAEPEPARPAPEPPPRKAYNGGRIAAVVGGIAVIAAIAYFALSSDVPAPQVATAPPVPASTQPEPSPPAPAGKTAQTAPAPPAAATPAATAPPPFGAPAEKSPPKADAPAAAEKAKSATASEGGTGRVEARQPGIATPPPDPARTASAPPALERKAAERARARTPEPAVAPKVETPAPPAAEPARTEVAAVAPPAPVEAPAPRLLTRVEPRWPREAVLNNIEGRVKARLTLDASGQVTAVVVVDAMPRRVFDRNVIDALQQWRYNEGAAGRTVETEVTFRR